MEVWFGIAVISVILVWSIATARTRYLKAETRADFDTAWHAAEELVKSGIKLGVNYDKLQNYRVVHKFNTMHIGDNTITFRDQADYADAYIEAIMSVLFHNNGLKNKRKVNLTLYLIDRGPTTEIVVNNEEFGSVEINVNIKLMPATALADLIAYVI